MIFYGESLIPDKYILKRWTKDARDILPESLRYLQKDSRTLKSQTFRDSLLYGTAMKAVKMGGTGMETFSVMMKHFGNGIKAVNEIISSNVNNEQKNDEEEYLSSDAEWRRRSGGQYYSEPELAAFVDNRKTGGLSSDVRTEIEMSELKDPLTEKGGVGRKKYKRFISIVESKDIAKKKKYKQKEKSERNFKQTSFCSMCRLSGHNKNTCPDNNDEAKKEKKGLLQHMPPARSESK
uniref:Uncharacterized protein n=1 Tax=Avena sativa TaxID=4498 RepID=A0ACD5W5R9_AVESA